MRDVSGRLLLSPSDLSGFLACPHLTQLQLGVARGKLVQPFFPDRYTDLIRRKGEEHEAAYLARLQGEGRKVVVIPRDGESGWSEARRLTEEAVRAREADAIYQGYLTDGDWQGFADFLERQPDGTYEPVDTKLARSAKPSHLMQLCFYAEQLERLQGRLPETIHVEPGSGVRESFRTADFMAYYRRVRERFLAALQGSPATYPWPCDHCSICSWRGECGERLRSDDNPVLVAGLGRSYVGRLEAAAISTLERLGQSPPNTVVKDVRPATFEGFRHQAELQLFLRRSGKRRVDDLPLEEGRGYSLLPKPSPGDLWIDFEGHPYYEASRGLEYLFGCCYRDGDGPVRYESFWAKDKESEKKAFEALVDRIVERRRGDPDMHVYHYADHERVALRHLMGEHGTREEEIDGLLRGKVLVDLYRVVRQALRASVESYSIKEIELLYGFKREGDVLGGGVSTVYFDHWLESGEPSLLEAIGIYNEQDCRSTAALHEWLLSRRPSELAWRPHPEIEGPNEKNQEVAQERDRVKAELLGKSAGGGDTPWLLAQLIDYHQREARPEWWEYFNRLDMDDEELLEDSGAIGGLVSMGTPVPDKRSFIYTFKFPAQEHKIRGNGVDPATKNPYVGVVVDDDAGIVTLRRAKARSEEPLPRALVPGKPLKDDKQREAIVRFARSYLAGDGSYPALVSVLERATPRVDLSLELPEAALTLEGSYLLVQGPPGAGKTWQGAKMAVALMRAGRRIGVTSLSHKGINKLLLEIEREAALQDFHFRGMKKHSDEEGAFRATFIESSDQSGDLLDEGFQLIAGTGWLFARGEFDHRVDTLFIDEAGQVSLADAIASGTSARNLVLLGDPNQLPQVSRGVQPKEGKASVLQHLLGGAEIVSGEMGVFLPHTFRLRPEACAFTSEAYYEGRLEPAPVCSRRSVEAGDGLVVIPVPHEGRSQSSGEEAQAVAGEIQKLLGSPFTDEKGTRPLGPEDILVVTPYNAQVRLLRSRVPEGVRVGTVDKFQGQEAPVVLISFASSSGEDAPRGIQFAFDRHRVNVATSRAQCRVVIVCSPRLLEAECRTVEQMRLMNALCRFVERAESRIDGGYTVEPSLVP
jgi:uncharacterized protein